MTDKPIIVDGIKLNVTADDFDDLETLELMEEGKFATGAKRVFGEKKYQEIKEKLRDPETGKVKASAFSEWFEKVAEKVGAKN